MPNDNPQLPNREAIAQLIRKHMPITWLIEDELRTAAFADGLADEFIALIPSPDQGSYPQSTMLGSSS